jgi:hypothetical protein
MAQMNCLLNTTIIQIVLIKWSRISFLIQIKVVQGAFIHLSTFQVYWS